MPIATSAPISPWKPDSPRAKSGESTTASLVANLSLRAVGEDSA